METQSEPAEMPDAVDTARLSDRDEAILGFEREGWRHPGAKEEAIRREFGVSAARYYQLLNALIDSPAAIVHDPMLVRRLQRVRDARTSERSTRTGSRAQSGRQTAGRGRIED